MTTSMIEASVIATGSVEQIRSLFSALQVVKQAKGRFRFLPKIAKFKINLKCFNKKEVRSADEAQDQSTPHSPEAVTATPEESLPSTSHPEKKEQKPSIFVRMFSAINKGLCNTFIRSSKRKLLLQ
ncbi:uncharacterized protein ACWYII_038446 isoform 1-T2 [Salvelinus alpinus]